MNKVSRQHRALLLFLLAAGVSACSVTPVSPPLRYFVLAPPMSPRGADVNAETIIAVGPVTVPAYLDRPEIVRTLDGAEIVRAADARWAEPLSHAVGGAVRTVIEREIPHAATLAFPLSGSGFGLRVAIDLRRLEATADGTVALLAVYRIVDASGRQLRVARAAHSVIVAGDSIELLVAAYRDLVDELGASIARALAALPAPREKDFAGSNR